MDCSSGLKPPLVVLQLGVGFMPPLVVLSLGVELQSGEAPRPVLGLADSALSNVVCD